MKKLVPVALVALVCLSGCLGVIGDDSASEPTEVDPSEADLPPGVAASGLENASVLVEAHQDALNREGFVLRGHLHYNVGLDEGSGGNRVHNKAFDVTVAPDGEPFDIRTHEILPPGSGPNATVTPHVSSHIWGNGSTVFGNLTVGNGSTTSEGGEVSRLRSPTRAPQFESFLTMGNPNYTVERVVERDGHTFTTLVANETVGGDGAARNLTAWFVVDERGIIHEAVLDVGNDRSSLHHEYRVVELGPDPPEAPDWVDNAAEPATTNESVLTTDPFSGHDSTRSEASGTAEMNELRAAAD